MSHAVHFYEDDSDLLGSIMAYIDGGLRTGSSVIAIARAPFLERLQERWLPLHADRFVSLDAADTLSRLLADGEIDPGRFMGTVGALVSDVAARTRHVYVFGEMVALLWGDKKYEAALELEELWSDLARKVPLTVLCAYPAAAFHGDDQGKTHICRHHDVSIDWQLSSTDHAA